MGFSSYQISVGEMPLYDDPILGLIGEVGEVAEHVKKDRRPGDRRKPIDLDELELELGDVLWYLTRLADSYGLDMVKIAKRNIEKLNERHKT